MKKMTETDLRNAFAGESQAHIRYMIFSEKAKDEGFPNVARLFRAISYAERVHATNHYKVLGSLIGDFATSAAAPFGLSGTSENLQTSIDGETFEVEEMYPVYKATAVLQGERGAEVSFDWALQAEKIHAALFSEAKQTVDRGEDPSLRLIQICGVCGYTVEGDAPDRCPICKAKKDKFKEFL